MRFRLAPMTLDDLDLENNLFSCFRRQYLANSTHHCRTLTFTSAIAFFVFTARQHSSLC